MARPEKYNWEAIEVAFVGGLDKDSICKRFKVTKKLLNNRILMKKWVVKGFIQADIDAISASSEVLGDIGTKYPEIGKIICDKVDTMAEDNGLIKGNRQLMKLAQSIIVKNKNNFDHTNIKNLTGAVKDIENIANPQANQKIEVTQNQAMIVKTLDDFYEA